MLRPATQSLLQRFGQGAMLALLLTQVVISVDLIGATLHRIPYSQSRNLARLLHREGLDRAVVIANPDVLLEPLPYYAAHPQWIVRERQWGHVIAFTKANAITLRLRDILTAAQQLRARTGRPVAIVLQLQLDEQPLAERRQQGYLGELHTPPGDVRAFLAATRRLARLGPAQTDEYYDVYVLR